jgi:predicted patatin/cPLA2 family phospholipase
MHQVVEHIKARKNLNGPHKDGKKIVLVIYGGTMASIRGAGALQALEEMGYRNAFDEIYTVSAGFLNASYFLAGQIKLGVTGIYKDLANSKFLNFFRLWRIMDIDYLINTVVKKTRVLNIDKLLANHTKLHVGLFNPEIDHTEYLEVHDFDKDEYIQLLRASMSVPYLFPGDIRVRGKLYEDMPFKKYYHLHHVKKAMDSGATDVLVIYNYFSQKKFEGKFKDKLLAIHNRLYDAVHKEPLPKHVFEIRPKNTWDLSRFETNKEPLKDAALQMGEYVKEIFGEKGPIQLSD